MNRLLLQKIETVVALLRNDSLLKFVRNISDATREANRLMNRYGAFCQRKYFDRIIRSELDFLEKWNYIPTNSFFTGLVEMVEAYPFLYKENQTG